MIFFKIILVILLNIFWLKPLHSAQKGDCDHKPVPKEIVSNLNNIKKIRVASLMQNLNIKILNNCDTKKIQNVLYEVYTRGRDCLTQQRFKKNTKTQEAYKKWLSVLSRYNTDKTLKNEPIILSCETTKRPISKELFELRPILKNNFSTPDIASASLPGAPGYPYVLMNKAQSDISAALFHEFFHTAGYNHESNIDYAYLATGCCFEDRENNCQLLESEEDWMAASYFLNFIKTIARPNIASQLIHELSLKSPQKQELIHRALIDFDQTYSNTDPYHKTEYRLYNFIRCQAAAELNGNTSEISTKTKECYSQFSHNLPIKKFEQALNRISTIVKLFYLSKAADGSNAYENEIQNEILNLKRTDCRLIPEIKSLTKWITKYFPTGKSSNEALLKACD